MIWLYAGFDNNHIFEICDYLTKIWIDRYKIKFVQCYINKILYFFNIVNFKNELNYAFLKKELKFLIDKNSFAFISYNDKLIFYKRSWNCD